VPDSVASEENIMRRLRSCATFVLICCIGVSTGGCFLNALLSLVVVTSISEEIQATFVTIQASASVRLCTDLTGTFGPGTPIECTYFINGQEIGSDFRLASQFGIFGVILDPLILQVPTAASNFSGTFGGMSTTGSLSITEVSGSLSADGSTTITPQAGTKLVVVDFPNPPPAPNQSYGFTLNFQLPGDATPVRLKALFAGRVQSNGKTFFVPLLPCETNFANIPFITLPASATFQNVNLPLTGIQGCNGRVFNLSDAATGIPTMSTWGLLMVVAVLLCYGAYRLRFASR
jgi:hypothetical protein